MKWIKQDETLRVPIKSWCEPIEEGALQQAMDLARHPVIEHHVALMPDCHLGYGMPIGGVIAVKDAILPSAVGVDIGCGMVAVETNLPAERLAKVTARRATAGKAEGANSCRGRGGASAETGVGGLRTLP